MMRISKTVCAFVVAVALAGLASDGVVPRAVVKAAGGQKEESQKGVVRGMPVLWEEPGNIESLDLFNGPGGAAGAPDLSGELTFVKDLPGGTSKKVIVADKAGRTWVVKFGPEARPETVATRFVWAVGYKTDIAYFVKQARVVGEKSFDVKETRFEQRPEGYDEIGTWSWTGNPFSEKREMEGLKLIMALLNNWDLKQVNNSIICPKKVADVSESKCYYYVSDLGATFGSTGSVARKIFFPFDLPAGSKGQPEAYADQQFIEGVRDGQVVFHYKGKNPAALHGVSLDTARWMSGMLARLSEKQLADAFRAGGYDGPENAIYVAALRSRINRLQQVSGGQLTQHSEK